VIFNSNEDPAREKMFINDLSSLSVAGIIISPALGNEENVNMIRSLNIPFVLCSRYIDKENDIYVAADDAMAGYLATRHLLDSKGCHVYFINSDMNISTARDRLCGYTRAFAEMGLNHDTKKIYAGAFSMKDGYRLAKTILKTAAPPFSLLCYSDYVAVGALQAISEAGLRIPEEVALMGIDNIEYSAFTNPQLSTVEMPSIRIGTDSAKLLLEIIESTKKDETAARGQIVFTPHIKIRSST
jgi:DNA-binding LacI/PurR family transcriptional regulator